MATKITNTFLQNFKTPAGVAVIINAVILLGNITFAYQLFPLANTIALLSQRVDIIEKKLDGQNTIIIPKGELDEKFRNIDNQLEDIKKALDSAKLR
jgi:uncharacterized membrane protein YcaP (DUF421 family)